MSKRVWNPGKTLLMAVITLPFLYPFVFLITTAFKRDADYEESSTSIPTSLTLENITSAWTDANLGSAMLHSAIAVSIAVVVTVTFSAGGAFWFLRNQGRLAGTLRWMIIGSMVVPVPVFILPLFIQLSDMNLTDNLIVVGLVFAAWNSAFGVYLLYVYLKGLPRDVFEAAAIDGASLWQQLRYVIVPLAKPAIVTLAVFSFIWSWSDLLIGVVLVQDPEQRLLVPSTALLADRYSSNIPRTTAGVVIAMAPMLLVFLAGQRALVRGILAGVGK